MTNLFADFRYALRSLRGQPTFVLIALLTLTVGIGANTAIFSVIKTVLLNPLPYPAPEQIVVLWEQNPDGNLEKVSIPTYQDWKNEASTIKALAAFRHTDFTYAGSGDPRNVSAVRATPELFSVLGVQPYLGRTFEADAAVVGADKVAVLSHGFWERTLGSDASIAGKTIELDAVQYVVVGVMPPEFAFPTGTNVEIWTPLAFDPNDRHDRSRRVRSLSVVGRLDSGTTAEQAQEEITLIAKNIAAEYASTNERWGAQVVPAHEQLVAASRPALMVLTGAVGFLLLIVCANMTNLMLARLSTRRRENAVRGALGANRWQVARPILAESLLLSFAGGILGTLAAFAGLRALTALPVGQLPRLEQIRLDSGVLIFTTCVSIVVAIAFGLLPALEASRLDLRDSLTESAGTTARPAVRRMLNGLVIAEVALALVLLVGAGLMLRSFTRLMAVDPGFDSAQILAAQVFLPTAKYSQRHERALFFEQVIERLRTAPGVLSASAISSLPMHDVGITFALPFNVEGQPPPATDDPRADVRMAAPGYFETMKIALIEGRFLDERDVADAPRTSVINKTMARRYFPDRSPVGQVIENPHGRSTVVGVIDDVRNQGFGSEPNNQVYLPLRQSPVRGMALVVRTEREPLELAGTIRREIWAVDAQQPIYSLGTMDGILARAVFLPRMSAALLAVFALTALLLAVLGIYGVLSYSVTQRTREIGLRIALGAERGHTITRIVRDSLVLIVVGVGMGLVGAVLLARSISGVLYGVSPFDLQAFSFAAFALFLAGLSASLIPALRATRVDPIVALREP